MIETFDTFVDDVFSHLDEIKKLYPSIPVYAFGHSMVSTYIHMILVLGS